MGGGCGVSEHITQDDITAEVIKAARQHPNDQVLIDMSTWLFPEQLGRTVVAPKSPMVTEWNHQAGARCNGESIVRRHQSE